MKIKQTVAILVVAVAITGAIFFQIENRNLKEQLVRIKQEQSTLANELSDYEELVHIDSMLLKGDYDTALNSYNESLKFHEENKMGIPVRIALAEKLINTNQNNTPAPTATEEDLDSQANDMEPSAEEIRKFDSINFTLEKTKVQLARLRRQLKAKSFGEYLKFKSKKGNQMHYVGQVKNGKANGVGIALLDSGSRYEGQWKNNERHGEGTFYWADGQYYVGTYNSDKRSGYGTYYWPNGEKYAGEWKEDKRQGTGKFFGSDGDMVTGGQWDDDELVTSDKKGK